MKEKTCFGCCMLFGVCFGSECLLLSILIDSLNANNKIK